MLMRGLIISAQSGFYTVKTESGYYTCRLRGRLKRGRRQGDIAAIGDWVQITPSNEPAQVSIPSFLLSPSYLGTGSGESPESKKSFFGIGAIEEVEARQHLLSRMAPTPHGEYQQIIVANPDQIVLVFSCCQPAPRLGMLDRFLVITEKQGIPAIIVANKVDLTPPTEVEALFGVYTAIGYLVIQTSAQTKQGVESLRQTLKDKISVLVGPSGAGKSSLLNVIQPGLGRAVRAVSQTTHKGKHTTVERQLFPLDGGGYVADTPGLKALALWDIQAEELDGYFPEMRDIITSCEYNDCRHVDEDHCAVRSAVDRGQIHPARYRSYLRMRLGREIE